MLGGAYKVWQMMWMVEPSRYLSVHALEKHVLRAAAGTGQLVRYIDSSLEPLVLCATRTAPEFLCRNTCDASPSIFVCAADHSQRWEVVMTLQTNLLVRSSRSTATVPRLCGMEA